MDIRGIITNPYIIASIASTGAFAVGFVLGYRSSRNAYEDRIREEVQMALKIRRRVSEEPEEVIEEEPEEIIEEETFDFIVHSDRIVKTDPGFFDYEKEVPLRTEDEPYIISVDEFNDECQEYDKISVEYYENEDVMLGDRIEPIPDIDMLFGNDNLTRFGYGSKDPRIVYIRNEHLETDWEVRLMSGSYVEDVLGYTGPPSDKVKALKFRRDDG